MTATERAAFTRSILDDPADDTRRLAFADWLDENGEPERAEFVRVQITLSKKPGHTHGQGYGESCVLCRGLRREGELLARHGFDWFKLPGLATYTRKFGGPFEGWAFKPSGGLSVEYPVFTRRGFVAEVRLSAAAFLGGPCERCRNTLGVVTRVAESETVEPVRGTLGLQIGWRCPDCYKSRTPGLARAIFAAHPVTRLVLTDKTPYRVDKGSFGWYDEEREGLVRGSADMVPRTLFYRLTAAGRNTVGDASKDYWAWYGTEQAALDALAAACVAYGRDLIGLPPL